MDDMNAGEVEEQLVEYIKQRQEIIDALSLSPTDEELLALKEELDNVIQLTNELLLMKQKEEEITRESERADLKVLNNPETRLDSEEESGTIPIASVVPAPEKPYKPKKMVIQPIPKSLVIQPDDPADIVRKKKKKIHMIKSKNRIVEAELERDEKKQNWQSFISGTKRKKTLKGVNPRRESIFKSPDSVEGKVGVTGSGKEMTENPAKRPKFSKSGVQGEK